jgi:mannitol/fructose-specific phosphotransferase system IIA component (Ntr-type)
LLKHYKGIDTWRGQVCDEVVDEDEKYVIGDNDQVAKVVVATKALNKHKNKLMEIFAMFVKDDIIPQIVDIENPRKCWTTLHNL